MNHYIYVQLYTCTLRSKLVKVFLDILMQLATIYIYKSVYFYKEQYIMISSYL